MKIEMHLLLGMFHFVPGGGSLVPLCPYLMTSSTYSMCFIQKERKI